MPLLEGTSGVFAAKVSSECKSYKSGPFRLDGASLIGEADRSRVKNPSGLR